MARTRRRIVFHSYPHCGHEPGRGVGVEILLSLGAEQVTGFDLDLKMIAFAQNRQEKCSERARVFVGDAEAIDAPDDRFDSKLEASGLRVQKWRQVGELAIAGRADKFQHLSSSTMKGDTYES